MLIHHLIKLIPFFATFIVLRFPIGHFEGRKFIERIILFLAIFAIWFLIRSIFLRIYGISGKQRSTSGFLYIPLIVLAVLQMILLQVIKSKIDLLSFQIIIVAILSLGFRDTTRKKGYYLASSSLEFFSVISIAMLSFLMAESSWTVSLILIAISISSLQTACYITELAVGGAFPLEGLQIKNGASNNNGTSFKNKFKSLKESAINLHKSRIVSVISLLLVAGPSIIVGMSVFGLFPSYFGAICIVFPLVASLVSNLQRLTYKSKLDNLLVIKSSGVYLIFTAMILILSLW